MNGTKIQIWERKFVVSCLPNGRKPADSHLQIFDNYIGETNLRLRKIRNPENDGYEFSLDKIEQDAGNYSRFISKIGLTQEEYEKFSGFRGRETRKNRYFVDEEVKNVFVDVFLGPLWGLKIATYGFSSESEASSFKLQDTFVAEVSSNEFYFGKNIVDSSFESIREELNK